MEKVDGAVQRIAKRRSWSDAEGKQIVAAWRQSGESRAAFARRYGIAVHRLYYWSATAGERRGASTERKAVQFHPVRVRPDRVDAGRAAPIEIRFIRLPRGFAADELRAVLSALEHPG